MTQLILKRATASRPSGEWNEDDYDVLADPAVVGRILKVYAAPIGPPWMWTLAFGHHGDNADARLCRDARGCDGRVRKVGGGNEMDRENSMRAIGLVLLSIAIMALLLTDADAKRRSSAQGSQAAGASGSWCAVHPRHGGENCGYTSFDQCWATIGAEGGWCRPNPFPGSAYGTGYNWSSRPPR